MARPSRRLPAAISAASTNGVSYTIRLAAGTYSGTFQIDGTAHPITLQGDGQGVTFLTAPANAASQTYLFAGQATVRNLTIQMAGTNSDGDTGLVLSHALADHVTVDGSGVVNARGGSAGISSISNSVFLTPSASGPGSTALTSSGGNTIVDTSLTGSVGLNLSDPGTVDNLSRVSIRADDSGVTTDGGTVNIDDAVIDLGTANGVGLGAVNFNNGLAAKIINANHVTIVGGGIRIEGRLGLRRRSRGEDHVNGDPHQLDRARAGHVAGRRRGERRRTGRCEHGHGHGELLRLQELRGHDRRQRHRRPRGRLGQRRRRRPAIRERRRW